MTLEEQRQADIITYANLMRIKAHETGENKELDYQIKVTKIVLQNFVLIIQNLNFNNGTVINTKVRCKRV